MWTNPEFPVDLVTFTEETFNWKLNFFVKSHFSKLLDLVIGKEGEK